MKKIYLNELEEKNNELSNYSKNDIALKLEELKKIPNNFIWEGLAKEKYLMGYNNKVNRLIELNNKFSKLSNFLLNVKEDYGNVNDRINNAYEELLSEFKE